jgi:hypothetical protein
MSGRDTAKRLRAAIVGSTVVTGAETTTVSVSQAYHGFSTGDAIYFNGTTWLKASADQESKLAHGLAEVTGTNSFVVRQTGTLTVLDAAFTPGAVQYLSATIPGALTSTDPSGVTAGAYSQPVGIALGAEQLLLLPFRPSGPAAEVTVVAKSGTYTANPGEMVVCTVNSSFTVTLPSPAGSNAGTTITVKRESGTAVLTISCASGIYTTSSITSLTVTANGTSIDFCSDGSKWQVV